MDPLTLYSSELLFFGFPRRKHYMDKSAVKIDPLRHVRFIGRTQVTPLRSPDRTKALSPLAGCAPTHCSVGPNHFISWVFGRVGLAADSYRDEPLQRRLSACLRALHTKTEAQARQLLEQRPDLLPTAIGALLIGVTGFFRDPPVFEALRTDILPEFTSLARPLRVWSAGCSTGAELYSLAILLAQAGLLEGSFLLGSDCRGDAVEQARASLYNSKALRNIETSDRRSCFKGAGSFLQPIELLRRYVHWKVADLARDIEEGPWDIILWRNMAIYLKTGAAASVWRGLASNLVPGGMLVVGRAERPPAGLPLINVKRCIYRYCPGDDRTFAL